MAGDNNHNDVAPACVTANVVASADAGVSPVLLSLFIASEVDLNDFVRQVNSGNTFSGMVVQLTADISVSSMAGTDANRFKGVFDGAGHTLTFNSTATQNYAAPFRYVEGATFTNLTVGGTIHASGRFAAGIVAHSLGNTSLSSCRSKVAIESTHSGDCTHGASPMARNRVRRPTRWERRCGPGSATAGL